MAWPLIFNLKQEDIMKAITVTRKELIQIFNGWNKDYFNGGKPPTIDHYADAKLGARQANDLIKAINKLQEDK